MFRNNISRSTDSNNKNSFILFETDYNEFEDAKVPLQKLINISNFAYINQAADCNHQDDPLLGKNLHLSNKTFNNVSFSAVLIITSYVGHDEVRSAHRQAMTIDKLRSLDMKRVFLLADIPPTEKYISQPAIDDENSRFGDLVQGNFTEAYRNLTYKHVMGLRWAANACPTAKYIIKIDDDTVFDILFLYNYLISLPDTSSTLPFLSGFVLDGKKPIRNVANKWYVSRQEYAGELYPDYLSGWLYVTNVRTALQLVSASQRHPFMWIDDTWVTGVLREPLAIPLTKVNEWFSANSQFLDCCIDDVKKNALNCDYHIGPNGGDVSLIVAFNDAMAKCYDFDGQGDGCAQRTHEHMLARTCIGVDKHLVEQHGSGIVQAMRL